MSFRKLRAVNLSVGWLVGLTYLKPGKLTVGSRIISIASHPQGLLMVSGSRKLLLKGSEYVVGNFNEALQIRIRNLFTTMTDREDVPVVRLGKLHWLGKDGFLKGSVVTESPIKYPEFTFYGGRFLSHDDVLNIIHQLPNQNNSQDEVVEVEILSGIKIRLRDKVAIALRIMLCTGASIDRQVSFTFQEDGSIWEVTVDTQFFTTQMRTRIFQSDDTVDF